MTTTPEIEEFLKDVEDGLDAPTIDDYLYLSNECEVPVSGVKVEPTRKAIRQIRELLSYASVVTDHPYDPMGTYDGTCTHMLPVEPPQGMIAWVQCGAEQYAHIDLDAL